MESSLVGLANFPPPTATDFLPQYKAIGASLKKRFFRKPNVAEAIQQYESLSLELQREEQKSFAGVCMLEAAKAQETLHQPVPQTNSLLKAGSLFLGAWESEKHFLHHPHHHHLYKGGGGSESTHLFGNLELGIATWAQAAKSLSSQGYKGLALRQHMELGDILFGDGSYGEALNHYKAALVSAKMDFSFPDQLGVAGAVVAAKIKLMEFESALKTVNDVLIGMSNYEADCVVEGSEKKRSGVALPVLLTAWKQKLELTKVLLVLILGGMGTDLVEFIWPKAPPPPQSPAGIAHWSEISDSDDIYSSNTRGLGRSGSYGNGIKNQGKTNLEVTYLLKSLVLAVQEGSSQDLKSVHSQLIPIMEEPHHDLMRFLIKLQS